MSGLFAVNKPSGISSAGLLNDLQHILKKSPLFEAEIHAQQARANAGRKGRKQKMGNKIKMGHGGTLDPLASGVLVVGTGRGTKDLGKFLSCSKDYEAIALFGCSTDTYDSEGKIVHKRPWQHITREMLEQKLSQFRGDIMQTPPIYSALKMQGKPLYEYAREGKPLPAEIKARPATVSRFDITKFTTEHEWTLPKETASTEIILSAEALEQLQNRSAESPGHAGVNDRSSQAPAAPAVVNSTDNAGKIEASASDLAVQPVQKADKQEPEGAHADSEESIEPPAKKIRTSSSDEVDSVPVPSTEKLLAVHINMTVSSGTYVRSLIHDLGIALGSAAHMVALVRKRVGEFKLEESVPWESFEAGTWQEALQKRLDFDSNVIHEENSPSIDDQQEIDAAEAVRISNLSPIEQRVGHFLQPCKPFRYTLTYAQSLDGKISGPNSKPLTISCPESFRVTHELRRLHDMILIGVGTAQSDDPGLNARDSQGKPYALTEQPIPVIIDPHGKLHLKQTSKLMSNFRKKVGKHPVQLVHETRRGQVDTAATVIYLDRDQSESGDKIRFAWSDIFDALTHLGQSIMIEGGATVIADVLQQKAADQVIVTVAPTFVGNGTGLEIEDPVRLSGVRTECFGRDSVIAGRVRPK